MKKLIPVLLILVAIVALIISVASTSKKDIILPVLKYNNEKKGVVVVELFTSQGCSSCPSADRLLGKYADKENVIAMSFHVDYWNRLGWKDPFSQAAFSQRQQAYAESFGLNGSYTPQVVINGQKEMVGSDENKIYASIRKAQSEESSIQIVIDEVKAEGDKATMNFTIAGNISNPVLNVALIQNKITTSIKAGENGGVQLTNYNVVRNFKSVNSITSGKNNVSIDLIPGLNKKDLSVVLFLQNNDETKISAAARSSL